jgi:hypothetical protein
MMHYGRWHRNGDPLIVHRPRGTPEQRFWAKVRKGDGCWEWTAAGSRGYGVMGLGGQYGKRVLAHRFSWELHNGPIPDGLNVCHQCDNPPCVRPDHLFLGTHADNVRDLVSKGRNATVRAYGEAGGSSKLTNDQVMDIRRQRAAGVRSRVLADRYGISRTNVRLIVIGKSWSHLPLMPKPWGDVDPMSRRPSVQNHVGDSRPIR